ncbi:hypothetical protein [Amycolatopsis sp. NPDC051903]|uniref:hypothetical protein n=1 Tax=Amycolatopsis sp. NPDC051903 TaxID=3363936 RepID=UPI0037A91CD2
MHLLAAITQERAGCRPTPGPVRQQRNRLVSGLLNTVDPARRVATADTRHTTAAHAHYLHSRDTNYVFIVNEETSTASTRYSGPCPGTRSHHATGNHC